jgi:oligosaccharide repeat unit polymerase
MPSESVSVKFKIYRRYVLNPIIAFLGIWCSVVALYKLRLSELLLYDGPVVFLSVLAITMSFVFGGLVSYVGSPSRKPHPVNQRAAISEQGILLIKNGVYRSLTFWTIATTLEILYSGGVPLYWIYVESDKTYFDFGLPSLHGFLNALILATSLCCYFLGTLTGEFRYKTVPLMLTLWGVIVVSRNIVIVNLIQCSVLYLLLNPPLRVRSMLGAAVLLLLLILGFGWLGDARSGARAFVELALPSSAYPDFLPSGFLWIYIYITTPFNNLIHHISTIEPEWNLGLTNAMALVLPSVIRNLIYDAQDFYKGNLVSEAFNVSTAFLDIYKDIGFFGIIFINIFIGYVSMKFWRARSTRSIFFFAVIMQSNILSIFFNHYFYLPIAFQYFVFIYLIPSESEINVAK